MGRERGGMRKKEKHIVGGGGGRDRKKKKKREREGRRLEQGVINKVRIGKINILLSA